MLLVRTMEVGRGGMDILQFGTVCFWGEGSTSFTWN